MSSVPIIKVQCMDCSGWFPEGDVHRFGESVIRCYKCAQRQRDCIQSFNEPPERCPHCNRKVADMIAERPNQPFPMFMHLIDGRFELLCASCDAVYIQKRADLYGRTRFGFDHKIR